MSFLKLLKVCGTLGTLLLGTFLIFVQSQNCWDLLLNKIYQNKVKKIIGFDAKINLSFSEK